MGGAGFSRAALQSLIIDDIIVPGRSWAILLRTGLATCQALVELRITGLNTTETNHTTDPNPSPLSFPNLRVLDLSSILPDILAALFPIADVVELSCLSISSNDGLDGLDEVIFPSIVDGNGRGLRSASMNSRKTGAVRIHIGDCGMSILDKGAGLDVYLEVRNLWEKLVQVAEYRMVSSSA